MSYAVKGVSTERGLDAAAFTLIAYGGAGPLHASQIAREIGMSRIIVPRAPGHFCAFGMLHSDLRYDFVRTWFTRLEDAPFGEIERIYAQLIAAGPQGARRQRRAASRAPPSPTPPTCATSARSIRSRSISSPAVFKKRDRDAIKHHFDEVHLRALRHQRPRGARGDRQPARHRHRPDEEAAARTHLAGAAATPSRAAQPRHAHLCSFADRKAARRRPMPATS